MSKLETKLKYAQNDLRQAQAANAACQSAIRDASAKKEKYQRRKSEVERVKRALSNSFDWNVNAISGNQRRASESWRSGSNGFQNEATVASAFTSQLEKHTENDGLGSQMHENLQREINDCQRKIEEADSAIRDARARSSSNTATINSLSRQIRQLKKDIAKGA